MNEQEIEMVINFGALGYSTLLCAQISNWLESEFIENEKIVSLYQQGQAKAEYVIDLKLFEQAQQGDIKSLEKLEERKKLRKRKR